ncbi:MAG: hypothetical protein EAZ39_20330 [Oscillatoriales cyanobacterium]|nr:MAG: hypothetical protein EAZ45_13190 [Oscillatoriales cyanobacterium]TAG15586.1 MAG: hypothetical protein EAZ39_20330 [Oscillatoriales cyanobacterium]
MLKFWEKAIARFDLFQKGDRPNCQVDMIWDKLILKLFPKYRPFPQNFNQHPVPPFLRGARGDQSETKPLHLKFQ